MHNRWPKAEEMLLETKEDILVYKTFPEEYRRAIQSINPLEHLNREIRRRTGVVSFIPDRPSVYRLVGTLLMNIDEDWRAGRYYMGKAGVAKIVKGYPERKNKEYFLEVALVDLEAQKAIYTT